MLYIEDLKIYVISVCIFLLVLFLAIFAYKWQTRPLTNLYCGSFNDYYCPTGVCDYIKKYEKVESGYCRNKFISF